MSSRSIQPKRSRSSDLQRDPNSPTPSHTRAWGLHRQTDQNSAAAEPWLEADGYSFKACSHWRQYLCISKSRHSYSHLRDSDTWSHFDLLWRVSILLDVIQKDCTWDQISHPSSKENWSESRNSSSFSSQSAQNRNIPDGTTSIQGRVVRALCMDFRALLLPILASRYSVTKSCRFGLASSHTTLSYYHFCRLVSSRHCAILARIILIGLYLNVSVNNAAV